MGSPIREKLLTLLVNRGEEYLSGEEISRQLQCSRTAIWKHMQELRKEGYEIEARPKIGYRLLYRPDRVAPEELKSYLKTRHLGHSIRYLSQTSSTQALAHQWAREGAEEGSLVITEEQTEGRGRMGRSWHSPSQSGIWMSLILRPPIPLTSAPHLTLLASVAVTRSLKRETGLPIWIKWPNDLLINGKKICGILTELRGEQDQIHYIVMGIGINVNVSLEQWPQELTGIATSLEIEGKKSYSRPKLIASILRELEGLYLGYLEQGFEPIRILWEEAAGMIGKQVTSHTPQGVRTGTALGLAPSGALNLETKDGIISLYSSDIEYPAF